MVTKAAKPVKNVGAERRKSGGPGRSMTPEHKDALAAGRDQGRAVRAYLETMRAPRRGRQRAARTPEQLRSRIAAVETRLDGADPLTRLLLLQERIDLQGELERGGIGPTDVAQLEETFVGVAARYSERKGISRAAWRAIGVHPKVLDRAGIR